MENQNIKRSPGRPRSENITRDIYLDPANLRIRGRGQPAKNSSWLKVTIQRSIKNSEYFHGTTPFLKSEMITIPAGKKEQKLNSNVSVVVIEAEKNNGEVAAPVETVVV
jgi:hypothetical protein